MRSEGRRTHKFSNRENYEKRGFSKLHENDNLWIVGSYPYVGRKSLEKHENVLKIE